MSRITFLLLITITCVYSRTIKNFCNVSSNFKTGDFKEPQPLILSKNKTATFFLYPIDKKGTIKLETSEKILVACPGSGNYIKGIPSARNLSELEITCFRDKIFKLDSHIFNLTSVSCNILPSHEARRTSQVCYNNSKIIEIGFPLEKFFLRTLAICRDDKNHWTHYTEFNLPKEIGVLQTGYPRPSKWSSGDFYDNYSMDKLYLISTQLKSIADTVGSEELASKYITTTRYISKGHLVAKADFIYGSAQRSTFWYMNAAPQWKSFNGGNWNSLEGNVRRLAEKRSLNLIVYTGIHGQMTLIDINGNETPAFMHVDGTQKSLPVPRFYWKIIYDPLTKMGTAFIGLNDPYAIKIQNNMFICENISEKIKWLTWKAHNITKGVSYACTIDDLRKVVPSIPNFEVLGLLA